MTKLSNHWQRTSLLNVNLFMPIFLAFFSVTDTCASYKPVGKAELVNQDPFIFKQSWKNTKTNTVYTDIKFKCEDQTPVDYDLSDKDLPNLDLTDPESRQTFQERLKIYVQDLSIFNMVYLYEGIIDNKPCKIKHIPFLQNQQLEFEHITPSLNSEIFMLELSELWVKIKNTDIRIDLAKKLKGVFGRKPLEKIHALPPGDFDRLICVPSNLKGRVRDTVGDCSIYRLPYLPGIEGFTEEGHEKKHLNYIPGKDFYLEDIGAIASRIYTQEEIEEGIGEVYEFYDQIIEEDDDEFNSISSVTNTDLSISEDLYLPSLFTHFRRMGGEKRIEIPLIFCDGKGKFFLTQSFEQDCFPLSPQGEINEKAVCHKVHHTRLTSYPIELKTDTPLKNIPQGLYYLNAYGVWMHLNEFYEPAVFKFTSKKYEIPGSLMDDVMNQKPTGYQERMRAWRYILETAYPVTQAIAWLHPLGESEDGKFFSELSKLFYNKARCFLEAFGHLMYSPSPPYFNDTVWGPQDPKTIIKNYPEFDGNENHDDRVEAVFEKLTELVKKMPKEQRKLLTLLSQGISIGEFKETLEKRNQELLEKKNIKSLNFAGQTGLQNHFKLFQTLGDFNDPLKIYKGLITNDIKKSLEGLGTVQEYVTLTCQDRYAELKNHLVTNPSDCGLVKMILDLKPEESHLRIPLLTTAKRLKNLKDPELFMPCHTWSGNGHYPIWTTVYDTRSAINNCSVTECLEYTWFMYQQKSEGLKFLPLFRSGFATFSSLEHFSHSSHVHINLCGMYNPNTKVNIFPYPTQEVWNDLAIFVNMDACSSFEFTPNTAESDFDLTICNFALALRNLKHLRKFQLPRYIGFKNFQFLIKQLAENRSVTQLDYGQIYGESPVAAFGELLAKNNTIKNVSISAEFVHDLECLNVLGDGLALNTGLEHLSIQIHDNLSHTNYLKENIDWLPSNPSNEYMKCHPRRPLRKELSQTFNFNRLKEGILKSNLQQIGITVHMNCTSSPSYPARKALESMFDEFKDSERKPFNIRFSNGLFNQRIIVDNK